MIEEPDTDGVRIRRATPEDATALTAFMARTFVEANGHCSSPDNVQAFVAATYEVSLQREEIADPSIDTLLAIAARGDWCGYAQLHCATRRPGCVPLARPFQLGRLYVVAREHGRGVAQALLRALLERVRQRGGDGLWLGAWTEAPRALAFYARAGFRIVGRSVFVVGDDAKDNWVLACALDADALRTGMPAKPHAGAPTIAAGSAR